MMNGDLLGSFLAKLPPLWTFVPALFLFTMLFRGQAAQEGPVWRRFILHVMPAVGIAILVSWLLQAQDFLWSLVMSGPIPSTAPAVFVQSVTGAAVRGGADSAVYTLVTPLWLSPIVVIAAALVQWFYADRVIIATSDSVSR